ncbi:hypothetical protein ACTFIZ_007326 [Dictyostelium cf. discoideum]
MKNIIFSIFVFIFISFSCAQNPLDTNQYECARNLITVLGTSHSFPIDSTLGYIDFCNKYTNIITCTNNDITFFKLNQFNKSHTITFEDFSCLKNLTQAWFIGCIADKGLLLNTFPSKLTFFNFEKCIGVESLLSNPISPTIEMLNIVVNTTINLNLPLSYIKDTSIGFYLTYQNNKTPGSVFTVENDLTSQYKTSSLTLHCDNLFSLKYISASQLTFKQLTHPVEGYSFLSTLESTYLFYNQEDTTEIPFPNSIAQITFKVSFIDLSFTGGFSKPNSIIDLSNLPITVLRITTAGLNFNLNGDYPIKYSMSTLQVSFSKGNLTEFFNFNDTYLDSINLSNNKYSMDLPSIDIYKIVKKVAVNLDSNKFTGTIDKSWCSVDLSISNNLLTGELPSCFTCFYNYRKTYLAGNGFTNISPLPPCTTVIPNLKYEKNELSLYGQDLGFDSSFSVVPSITGSFVLKNYSSLFVLQVSNLKPTVYNITFTKLSKTFTLSSHPINPKVNKVSINSNNQLVIDGSYFTYNESSVSISVGSISCIVESVSFYQIVCTTSSTIQASNNSILVISINDLFVQVSINENLLENNVLMCPDSCFYNRSQGVCEINGICQCKYSEWVGIDCNTPAIKCTNQCINNGECDFTKGICKCPINYIGDICEIPIHEIISVSASFESGGNVTIYGWFGLIHDNINVSIGNQVCTIESFNETTIQCISKAGSGQVELVVEQNGLSVRINYTFIKEIIPCSKTCLNGNCSPNEQCNCYYGWAGSNCSVFIHYITSVSPSTINGGQVVLEGSFGLVYENLTVKIGNLECNVDSVNQSTIVCNIGAGIGLKSINVTQNGIVYIAKDKYHYIQLETNQEIKCPNDCSGNNGICLDNNICSCNSGWSGLDCSAIIDEETDTFVNSTDGSSTIINRETKFKISVISLNEIDFSGKIVEIHSLDQWVIDSSNATDTIHTFNQKLNNNNATITYIIEEVKDKDKQFEFAGISFIVNKGSIKITIKIDNYQYKSQLNTLDLLIESKVTDSNLQERNNDCNSSPSEISNQSNEDLYYIKIEKNSKVFFGRFISKMISNGRPTYLPSEIVSGTPDSSIIALKLTHCDNCIIDPDFSVLLSSDFDKTCDKSGTPSYIIALSVVLPVFGICAIVVSIVYYRNHQKGKKLLNLVKKFSQAK